MQATVTLEQQQWQAVINLLAKQPFDVVAPLIFAIQQQIMSQQAVAQVGGMRANGMADAEAA